MGKKNRKWNQNQNPNRGSGSRTNQQQAADKQTDTSAENDEVVKAAAATLAGMAVTGQQSMTTYVEKYEAAKEKWSRYIYTESDGHTISFDWHLYVADRQALTDPASSISVMRNFKWWPDVLVRRNQDLECALRGLELINDECAFEIEDDEEQNDYEICEEEDMSSSAFMDEGGHIWIHGNFKARRKGSSEILWFFVELMSTRDPDNFYVVTAWSDLPDAVVEMKDARFGCRACVHMKHLLPYKEGEFNTGTRPLLLPRLPVQEK